MADETVVHIGENSPEQVAYKLLLMVSNAEKKNAAQGNSTADRDWIVRTFCMCLKAVQQPGFPDDALQLGRVGPSR